MFREIRNKEKLYIPKDAVKTEESYTPNILKGLRQGTEEELQEAKDFVMSLFR